MALAKDTSRATRCSCQACQAAPPESARTKPVSTTMVALMMRRDGFFHARLFYVSRLRHST